MITVRAYSLLDGLLVKVEGNCTGLRHKDLQCPLLTASRLVQPGALAQLGEQHHLVHTLEEVLTEYPGLMARLDH